MKFRLHLRCRKLKSSPTGDLGHSGFTLIELLVVIAIIALLSSLLMPLVKATKTKATGIVFQSNLRQVALALYSLAQDNDGKFPAFYETSTGEMWQRRLLPYINETTDTPVFRSVLRDPIVGDPHPDRRAVALNGKSRGDTGPPGIRTVSGASNRRLLSIAYPSQLMLIGAGAYDKENHLTGVWGSGGSIQAYDIITHGVDQYIRYNGGNYYAFVDGHVKYITREWLLNEAFSTNNGNRSRFFDSRAENP